MTRRRGSTVPAPSLGALPVGRIVVAVDAHTFARANADEHAPDETGGVVIGHTRGDTVFVTRLTGPGPHAVHRPDWFVRDGAYAQAMLEAAVAETDGRDNYLGEWHSHPIPQGPSAQDRESMRRISRNAAYDAPHPLLVLCRRHRRSWRLEGHRWDGARLVPSPLVQENPPPDQTGTYVAGEPSDGSVADQT